MNKIILKSKRAVSPVIATVLLISLVVAASALVYFIVVPMLKGQSTVNMIATQWFDTTGDNVVDRAYLTLQNTGSASALITEINVTIETENVDATVINGTEPPDGYTIPITIEATERIDLVIDFDSFDYVELGSNEFRIRITYDNDLVSSSPENMKHVDIIEPLDFTVLNPIDTSWASGIIDPQAIATGGFQRSSITYDFRYPNGTVALDDQTLTDPAIDSTDYADASGYEIEFTVSDQLGQSETELITFGIDNEEIGITFFLTDSSIDQGDSITADWSFTIAGAPLINQTLVLGGNNFPYQQMFTSSVDTITEYTLTGAQTAVMAQDELVFTLYIKDAAGNLNQVGEAFDLNDIILPSMDVLSPLNNTSLSEIIIFEVITTDASGINPNIFNIRFDSLDGDDYSYTYLQSIHQEAIYIDTENKWYLEFNSFILADHNYSIEITVQDAAGNTNKTLIDFVVIDNEILDIYGAVATDGRGGFFFRRRGVLTFYIESKVPTSVTITNITMNWQSDGQITHVYDVYDDTAITHWLASAGGPYTEDTIYDIAPVAGGIEIDSSLDHHITIRFDYADRPEGKIFTFSFYVEEFAAWETIVIDYV